MLLSNNVGCICYLMVNVVIGYCIFHLTQLRYYNAVYHKNYLLKYAKIYICCSKIQHHTYDLGSLLYNSFFYLFYISQFYTLVHTFTYFIKIAFSELYPGCMLVYNVASFYQDVIHTEEAIVIRWVKVYVGKKNYM